MIEKQIADFETEIRKVPGLDESDIQALLKMCVAGFDYGKELISRQLARGMLPICKYTSEVCKYRGKACTCCQPDYQGKTPTHWVSSDEIVRNKEQGDGGGV